MRISQRLQDVRPSITLAITARARALSRSGVDVVAFGAASPASVWDRGRALSSCVAPR